MLKKALTLLARSITTVCCILGIVVVGAISFETFIYDFKGASVVKLTRTHMGRSGGTGFQIKAPSGKLFVLTNAHICSIGNPLVAHKQNGDTQMINVVEIYKEHDLCLMEPVDGLRPLSIASSLNIHERVWLIGHPALRPLTLESGHFVGNIDINLATKCSQAEIEENARKLNELIKRGITPDDLEEALRLMFNVCLKKMESQHINNIAYGGNSGSPVVNAFGNVIGVLFAGRRDQATASHTVPLADIQEFLKDK